MNVPKFLADRNNAPLTDLADTKTIADFTNFAGQGSVAVDPLAKSYAPPQIRGLEQPARTVKTFSELLTRELDDIVAAAEAEIAALKSEAQGVRDMYTTYTDGIAEDIKRLQEGVALSMKTMLSLREQCAALNATPKAPIEAQKEIPF